MKTIVYGKPACVQCDATERLMKRKSVPYEYRSLLDQSPAQIDAWKTEGHMSAPIVVAPDGTWSGYKPDQINALAEQTEEAA